MPQGRCALTSFPHSIMKISVCRTFAFLVSFSLLALGVARAEQAPEELKAAIKAELVELASWPAIVETVRHGNAAGQSLDSIKAKDKVWIATAGTDAFMQSLMGNDGSKALLEAQSKWAYIAEAFLTDHLGANVAMTQKTSDYWQGDESKFTGCFTGGVGTLHFGEVDFDESSQSYCVHVSIPVLVDGVVGGVLILSVDLDAFEGK